MNSRCGKRFRLTVDLKGETTGIIGEGGELFFQEVAIVIVDPISDEPVGDN